MRSWVSSGRAVRRSGVLAPDRVDRRRVQPAARFDLSPSARLAGHLWTVGSTARLLLRPPAAPASVGWQTVVHDPLVGAVQLRGYWSRAAGDAALVVVHGLGGHAASPYVVRAAAQAVAAGLSCLRLSLRGADGGGEDLYHAGLTADLTAALRSPALRSFRHVLLLGYSLGGHLCLRAACDRVDERIRAVAAVCPPLDLAAVQRAIDSLERWPYRHYLLTSLKLAYWALARRRSVPVPVRTVCRVRSMRGYDSLVVVPRFGFRDVDDYYERTSVGPALAGLVTPALIVASLRDPMVPAATLAPHVARASSALEVRWLDEGGHLYFPADQRLDPSGEPGLEAQLVDWLVRQLAR